MVPISIVIPALNEEHAIGPVIDALASLPLQCEIIVVDDGSTDATARIAREKGATVVRHAGNVGYGASIKDGIRAASHTTIVLTDADGTYPADRIPHLVERFEQGFDMVVGARQGASYRGSLLKMPARFIFTLLAEFTTGRTIPDVNSGMRVFRKNDVLPYFSDICNGFSFTTTITLIYMLTGKSVTYIPISYEKRIGRSKVKIIRDSLRTLQYMTEVIACYNPLKLFLLLSLLALLWGIVCAFLIHPFALFFGATAALIIFALGVSVRASRK